ncbi:MAG TPA: hypothetical protein DCR25_05610 [Rhodobacter sp.]|nr:hypothetical protein [Rhodobacter sp.]
MTRRFLIKTGVSLLWAGYIDRLAYNGLDFALLPNLSVNAVWALQNPQKLFGSLPTVLCPFS